MKKLFVNNFRPLFLLLLATLLFFSPNLFKGEVLYYGDNLQINIPSKVLLVEMVRQRILPLWNPYLFSGSPFLADINLGLLYPFNFLYFFLNPFKALTYIAVLEVFLSGLFTYFYGKIIGLKKTASFFAALIFMFSGGVILYLHNTAILNVVVWIPLIFYLTELFFKQKSLKKTLFLGVVLALQVLAGHPQITYYTFLIFGGYVFCRFPGSLSWKLKFLGLTYFWALAFGAIQLIPFLEAVQFSTRPADDFSFASIGSMSPVTLITFLMPNFFGVLKNGTSWGAQANIAGYLGLAPFLLALIPIIKFRKNRVVIFFTLLAILCFLLVLGKTTPLLYFFTKVLPGFGRFRDPNRLLVFYSFSLAILAGFGFQKLGALKLKWLDVIRFSLLFLVLVFFLLRLVGFEFFNHFIAGLPFCHRLLEYSLFKRQTIFQLWTENLIVSSFILFVFALVFKKPRLIILLTLFDLFFFCRNVYFTAKPASLMSPPEIISFLKINLDDHRLLAIADGPKKPDFGDPEYFFHESLKTMILQRPNVFIFNRFKAIDGYAALVSNDYAAYFSGQKNNSPTGIEVAKLEGSQLDVAGAKYIITGGFQEGQPVFTYHSNELQRDFWIYENTGAYPRVFLLNQNSRPIGEAKIVDYQPNEVEIKVAAPEPAKLVLTDTYYPGWQATVDSIPATIEKYEGVFRSLNVSSGEHLIKFTYRPLSFYLGAAITALAIGGAIIWYEKTKHHYS